MNLTLNLNKKTLTLFGVVMACGFITAQTPTVPNTGANTTLPPAPTYTSAADRLANPTNSTTPGASGTYTIDLSKPDMTSPPVNSYTTPYQPTVPGNNTYSPQTGNSSSDRSSSTERKTRP